MECFNIHNYNMRNYYEILQIQPGADQATVKAAYRTLMFKYRCHPDLGGNEGRAKDINEAYETLCDPDSRREYDSVHPEFILRPNRDEPQSTDRRRIVRIPVNLNVKYEVPGGGGIEEGRLADISFLGCRLQTKRQVDIEDQVIINIGSHKIIGTVRWNRMFHPTRFGRLYEIDLEFLREFDELDTIRQGQPS